MFCFIDDLVDIIVDKSFDLDCNSDDANFMTFGNFPKGCQAVKHADKVFNDEFMNMEPQPEIKYLGVPHAPKHQRPPKRFKQLCMWFPLISISSSSLISISFSAICSSISLQILLLLPPCNFQLLDYQLHQVFVHDIT